MEPRHRCFNFQPSRATMTEAQYEGKRGAGNASEVLFSSLRSDELFRLLLVRSSEAFQPLFADLQYNASIPVGDFTHPVLGGRTEQLCNF
jgi:hypothetical protein